METDPLTIVLICNEPPIYDLLFAERCAGKPYALADAERFLAWAERGWCDGTHFVYLIRGEGGGTAGAVDIKSANLPSAEIGYWLGARHSGVMTNAVRALCELAQIAGYAELFELVRQTNLRSANVLARAGRSQKTMSYMTAGIFISLSIEPSTRGGRNQNLACASKVGETLFYFYA